MSKFRNNQIILTIKAMLNGLNIEHNTATFSRSNPRYPGGTPIAGYEGLQLIASHDENQKLEFVATDVSVILTVYIIGGSMSKVFEPNQWPKLVETLTYWMENSAKHSAETSKLAQQILEAGVIAPAPSLRPRRVFV